MKNMIHWFGNKKHTRPFIPQIEPWIDGKELKQLKRVIKSTYVVENKLTAEFENIVANLAGAKHAVAMTNGTAALFCALKSLGIGAGDEVLVPNLTFVASANAVTLAGAKPIFCEIDERTMQICPNKLPIYLTDRTAAIMPVHLYGQAADMDLIMRFCRKNGLKCIEDAAQGVGVKFNGQHVGTFGDIGVFSYYGNKTITCGEGGVVVTNNDDLKTQCYRLKNHGRDTKGIFEHEHVGYNFAFTDMQAAIGIAQMGKLEKIIR
jgi:perosamine synthetase